VTFDWSRQRVLVIAPHPDDELIGCGGLMSRIKREGGEVHVLYVTVADTPDFSAAGVSTADERLREIKLTAEFYPLDSYHLALPGEQYHLKLDNLPRGELMALLERPEHPLSIPVLKPTVVITPDITSYNQAHKAMAHATISALRPGPDALRHQPSLVLMYEEVADGWSGEQVPNRNFFVELTGTDLDRKIEALKLHASQWREHPHTRSELAFRSLAAVRGVQSGRPYAEAFHCLRWRG